MNDCKTVTLRTRPLKNRMLSFYLDYYPGYRVLYFTKPWGILVLFDWSVLYICKFFIHNDMF